MKPYYMAYEERYKKVHGEGATWFSDKPTPELMEWISFYNIPKDDEILEIGCGEGRDALFVSGKGYRVTAVDASATAIGKCRELSEQKGPCINWRVANALYLDQEIEAKFIWIYSVATLHMLVEDTHRRSFLKAIHSILAPNGRLLLVSMGDGKSESRSDTSTAFELQERTNDVTGEKTMVAGTSYRGVNWETHRNELEQAGFAIEKAMNTKNHEYGTSMTVYAGK